MPSLDAKSQTAIRLVFPRPAVVLVTLGLGGCALFEPTPRETTPVAASTLAAPAVQADLSAPARAALDVARQRVADARRTRTLWTSALQKLDAAELAAAKKDSGSTIKLSYEIVALCELSSAQALRPPVVW